MVLYGLFSHTSGRFHMKHTAGIFILIHPALSVHPLNCAMSVVYPNSEFSQGRFHPWVSFVAVNFIAEVVGFEPTRHIAAP